MSMSSFAIQTAIYTTLTGSTAVTGAGSTGTVSIFDHVPQDSAFPYVAIGEVYDNDWSSKSQDGQEVEMMLHVWSRYRGMKEAKDIGSAIHTALHNVSLSPTGHRLVLLQFRHATYLTEPDGLTRHGALRYRALTNET